MRNLTRADALTVSFSSVRQVLAQLARALAMLPGTSAQLHESFDGFLAAQESAIPLILGLLHLRRTPSTQAVIIHHGRVRFGLR